MFVFGHLGIGKTIADPTLRRYSLPLAPLFIGSLLPDLIDKPLYYGLVALTGKRGAELELIHGTRTFGHTALLLLLILMWKRPVVRALALGVLTHIALDT